jgi:hypothetical protein
MTRQKKTQSGATRRRSIIGWILLAALVILP